MVTTIMLDEKMHVTDSHQKNLCIDLLDFLRLMSQARIVLTDSGGIQEETSYLNIPCLTLRENTERPITIKMGTNQLVGNDTDLLTSKFLNIFQ